MEWSTLTAGQERVVVTQWKVIQTKVRTSTVALERGVALNQRGQAAVVVTSHARPRETLLHTSRVGEHLIDNLAATRITQTFRYLRLPLAHAHSKQSTTGQRVVDGRLAGERRAW